MTGMAMLFRELADLLAMSRLVGDGNVTVTGVQSDHRLIEPGDVFVCIPGAVHDGHKFAAEAVAKGARALVAEKELPFLPVPQLIVKNTRHAVGRIAARIHGYPSREMKLVGVTGTNGKTTVTWLIDRIFADAGFHTGVLGTVGVKYGDVRLPAERTTQEAPELQRTLRWMADAGVDVCAMEVSSHALELGRVKGCRFRTAIFTNLTQDHLDWHGTMERYREAKGLLFARLGNGEESGDGRTFAVLNADDDASETFARLTGAQVITYGIEREADVTAKDISVHLKGTSFVLETPFGSRPVRMKLIGRFNVQNALAAAAAALAEGIGLDSVVRSLEAAEPVEGRMQTVDAGQDFLVLVDYAHTPDGLENALRSVCQFAEGKIITVFGCGGDRDRSKRPAMGRIAAEYSDLVFVTSDNPRSEEPMAIIHDILEGVRDSGYPEERCVAVEDRREAIRRAVAAAEKGDVVLIAGKGHETYQILKSGTIPFDDREVAREALGGLKR
jgi:UDP-N-acetylmuramoyl-L-alanyl-D-glutamate--2,6-diaminopimelate ligase